MAVRGCARSWRPTMLRVHVGGRYAQTPVGRTASEAGSPVPPALLQELGVRAAAPVTIAGLPAAAAAADMTVVQVENFAVCARKLAATSNRSRVAGGFLAFVGGEWAAVAIVRPRTVVFAGGSRRLQHHLKRVAAAPAAFMFSGTAVVLFDDGKIQHGRLKGFVIRHNASTNNYAVH